MGIPSYFSHIIRKYGSIIKKMKDFKGASNIYFDSNSLIYDIIRTLPWAENITKLEYERNIYNELCIKIDDYINKINPTNKVMIAFDGVAPVAKLNQQKTRRYKSKFTQCVENTIKQATNSKWDQASITPGTTFMNNLDIYIRDYFSKKYDPRVSSLQIHISCATEFGEGEHKLFDFIRDNKEYHKKTTTFIYGLDSDLIMLCLNHLYISKNIFLFRESPDFANSINSSLESNILCYLDIHQLSISILREMGCVQKNTIHNKKKIHDYIFISFMLGNDFMPHFPALNIRTNGISILLETYQNIIGNNKYLCDGTKINWRNVKLFIQELARHEEKYLKSEYVIRDKWARRKQRGCTAIEAKLEKFSFIPVTHRDAEQYIDPYKHGWELRYYKQLFHMNQPQKYIKHICTNYLEGLEWTMEYYTNGCKNYRWHYKYHYPPLLTDLVRFIPDFDTLMIETNLQPINALTQLCYVLPKQSLHLIPTSLHTALLKTYPAHFKQNYDFVWAFCKYFWECHVDMPTVALQELEEFVEKNI